MTEICEELLNNDLRLVILLQDKGPIFLDKCYQFANKNNLSTKLIDNYHQLYLDENELFDKNIEKYLNYENLTNLWNNFLETNQNDITLLNNIFDNFVKYVIKHNKYTIILKLFQSKLIHKIVSENKYWTYDNGNLFVNLISNISSKTLDISMVHKIIYKVLLNTNTRKQFFNWVTTITNNNVHKISETIAQRYEQDKVNKVNMDEFLIKLFMIMVKFWKDGNSKKQKIKYEYIIDENECGIKWYNKKNLGEKTKYNITTKCFYLTLNILRICYIPMIIKNKKWKQEGKRLKTIMDSYQKKMDELNVKKILGENVMFSLMMIEKRYYECDDEYKYLQNVISNFEEILAIQTVKKEVDIFYDHIQFIMLYKLPKINLDDVLDNFCTYINFTKLCTADTMQLILKIVKSREITSNPGIRFDYLDLILKIKPNISSCMYEVMEGMMILYRDMESYPGSNRDKMFKRSRIIHILSEFSNKTNTFELLMNQNMKKSKQFIGTLLNDSNEVNSICDETIERINSPELQRALTNPFASQEAYKRIRDDTVLLGQMVLIQDITYKFLRNILLMSVAKKILSSKELSLLLVSTLDSISKRVVDKYTCIIDYIKKYKIKFKENINDAFSNIGLNIVLIYNTMSNNKDFLINIVKSDTKFQGKYLRKMGGNLKEVDIVLEKVEQIQKKLKTEEEEEIEYPEEFLDPLMYTLIEDPIVIPEMNIIMDSSVINGYLLRDKRNPYTRKPLTEEQLDEFNKKEENIKLIVDFKKRFKEWNENRKK